MPLSKCPNDVKTELEGYLLECNYPKLERLAHRQRRQKTISEAMEHYFVAECDFQSRYLMADLDQAADEMEVLKYSPSSLDKALHECKRGLKEASVIEKIYLRCLLGKLLVFEGKYEEAIDQAFGSHTEEIRTLLKSASSSEDVENESPVTPTTTTFFFPQIVAIQASLCLGVALEHIGRARDALLPYSDVTEFCRRLPNQHAFLRAKSMYYFIGMSMYRYGMLCWTLAIDPRSLLSLFPSAASTGQLRGKLYFDAAVSLRMFLGFMPTAFGVKRHTAALSCYLDALEQRFRRANYRATFDSATEQYGDTLYEESVGPFCPATVDEDIVFCVQLLESITPPPTNAQETQCGSMSKRVCQSIARLARRGDRDGLVKYCQGLFVKYAAEASTYGRLILACAAAKQHEQVIRAGEIYFNLGGREPSILLMIAKTCVLFPSYAAFAVKIIEGNLIDCEESMKTAFKLILGSAYLRDATYKHSYDDSRELLEKAMTVLAEAVVEDETDAQTHFLLALAYGLQRKLKCAEDSIKTSLSLESEQPLAWYLFALIASARKDYDLCLSICNSFHESRTLPFIPISLVKVKVLTYLGLYEEAAHILSSLIGTFTDPAGPVIEDISSMSAVKLEESAPLKAPDPAQFRSRFYLPQEQSITATGESLLASSSPALKRGLTMPEYKSRFPEPAARTIVAELAPSKSFPESFLPSSEILSLLESKAIMDGAKSPLLSCLLWCWLGRVYILSEKTAFAELCAHEALLTSELSADTYCLKGEIMESTGDTMTALECYRLSLQMENTFNVTALLGIARCHSLDSSDRHRLFLALQAVNQAIEVDPFHVCSLGMAAELCRKLGNMDVQAEECFSRARILEESEPIVPWRSPITTDLFFSLFI